MNSSIEGYKFLVDVNLPKFFAFFNPCSAKHLLRGIILQHPLRT